MAAATPESYLLDQFLEPLRIDSSKLIALAGELSRTYTRLAAESENQFLPTPLSDSLLGPSVAEVGRYLAIDIGGTNLRVGFIELAGASSTDVQQSVHEPGKVDSRIDESRVKRVSEKSWPILGHLKHENAEEFFEWIGSCIAEVVEDGLPNWADRPPEELLMGVTFSFPMIQQTLSEATLMSMGKGFAITSNLDLAEQLRNGYSKAAAGRPIPPLKIVAIINDTVATLISFAYQLRSNSHSKAAMGLICGTGNNATIPLKMSSLHPSKRYDVSSIGTISPCTTEPRILINTEWSISGTAPPLHDLSLITNWDSILDAGTVIPGFMPFEYMTAGGYLGELGRIIVLDFLTTQLHIPEHTLPVKVRTPQGLSTTFLGHFRMSSGPEVLNDELPADENDPAAWQWTSEAAFAVGKIARAIQRRAAGMTAAAIIGLLICAEEIHLGPNSSSSSSSDTAPSAERDYTLHHPSSSPEIEELIVGYTGGCITHFQDYLQDCQAFLDAVIEDRFGAVENGKRLRVVLQECHDGGIVGAGVLAGSVQSLARRERD